MTLATHGLETRGRQITSVGLGAWQSAVRLGVRLEPQDDAASAAELIHAVSRGVNWVDTTAVYRHYQAGSAGPIRTS